MFTMFMPVVTQSGAEGEDGGHDNDRDEGQQHGVLSQGLAPLAAEPVPQRQGDVPYPFVHPFLPVHLATVMPHCVHPRQTRLPTNYSIHFLACHLGFS